MNLDDRKGRPDFEAYLSRELTSIKNENLQLKDKIRQLERALQDCMKSKVV